MESCLYRVIEINLNKYALVDSKGTKIYRELSADGINCNDVIYFDDNKVRTIHYGNEMHYTFYVTNKCNSNCIMCPDSETVRKNKNHITLQNLLEQVDVLPDNIRTIDITGGEPTLLKSELSFLVERILNKFFKTQIVMLSNGRSFADLVYTKEFAKFSSKNFTIEIPIHAGEQNLHDIVCGVNGGFEQTVQGIKNLLMINLRVNIRVVVLKMNIDVLNEIVRLVNLEFPQIENIHFMGLEMLGNAFENRDDVWIDFDKIRLKLQKALEFAFMLSINPQIYNFPLCMIDEEYWNFYRDSITSEKIVYLEPCERCSIKEHCGGFFNSTARHTKILS